jgi:5-methyltetrahydropteroyltriglutamate--homocysteine methyltransferase
MPRDKPPFRADHVGSLLRPQRLLKAREDFAAGNVSADELRQVEDDSIREVIEMQRDVGLQSATDGEFRRASWHMDFIYSLDGISKAQDDMHVEFRNEEGTIDFHPAALKVDGKLGVSETIFGKDFEFVKENANGVTPKQTIPSPSMVHYRGGAAMIDKDVYPDVDAFWGDLTDAYADEVRRMGEIGCTYLQFDDTSLAYLNDPNQRKMLSERGEDAEHLHEGYIRHINEALQGRPDGMTVTTHMCRGNFRSSWVAEGGYDFVAEALFNQLEVDGFFLEYDDARSGGFEPLRFVPKGKQVVLGLVTTKRGELEQKDDLKRRIEEASQYLDLDQICLSPQCGFSSTVEGNTVTYDEEVAKLRLIVEIAQEVWA